jgi:hypothetical protein
MLLNPWQSCKESMHAQMHFTDRVDADQFTLDSPSQIACATCPWPFMADGCCAAQVICRLEHELGLRAAAA